MVLQESQGFQEIPEEMGHVVLPERKGSLGRGDDYVDLVKSNWKQCVWKRNDDKDSDLIQVQEIKDYNYLSNSTNTRQRTLPGFQSSTAFWLRLIGKI